MTGPVAITAVREGTPYNALLAGQQVSFALAAANLYGAVLSAAAPGGALDPFVCFDMGRTLGTRGRWTGLIVIDDDGEPDLIPADLWINNGIWTGTTRPPSGEIGRSVVAPDDAVVNVRLPDGQPPLARLNPVRDIGARLEGALIAESESPVVNLIGAGPQMLNTAARARKEITDSLIDGVEGGKRVLVTPSDIDQARVGKLHPDPSETAVALRAQIRTDVEAAYGIPGLLSDTEGSSTALSGIWRVAVVRAFDPLANLVELEVARKIDGGLRFDRTKWHAAPHSEMARATAQRATAVQRLVAAGVEVDRAIQLAGMEGSN